MLANPLHPPPPNQDTALPALSAWGQAPSPTHSLSHTTAPAVWHRARLLHPLGRLHPSPSPVELSTVPMPRFAHDETGGSDGYACESGAFGVNSGEAGMALDVGSDSGSEGEVDDGGDPRLVRATTTVLCQFGGSSGGSTTGADARGGGILAKVVLYHHHHHHHHHHHRRHGAGSDWGNPNDAGFELEVYHYPGDAPMTAVCDPRATGGGLSSWRRGCASYHDESGLVHVASVGGLLGM